MKHNLYWIIENIKKTSNISRIVFPDIADQRVLDASGKLIIEWERPVLVWKKDDFTIWGDFLEKNNYIQEADFYVIWEEEDPAIFSAGLLKEEKVDWFVGGNISSTAHIVRSLIKWPGTQEWIWRISSYFIIENQKGLFFIADCAIQAEPNAEQLAEIAFLTAQNAVSYWIVPKIAMLSFSTAGSAKHPMVEKVQEATVIAREMLEKSNIWEYIIEWDIQLDAACKEWVWEKKNPKSELQWEANILIFPDLDSGNIWYKAIDFFGDSTSIWPILQGLSKPGNDLSRGCSMDEIVAMYYITKGQIISWKEIS